MCSTCHGHNIIGKVPDPRPVTDEPPHVADIGGAAVLVEAWGADAWKWHAWVNLHVCGVKRYDAYGNTAEQLRSGLTLRIRDDGVMVTE